MAFEGFDVNGYTKSSLIADGLSVTGFLPGKLLEINLVRYQECLISVHYHAGFSHYVPDQALYKELNIPENPELGMSDAVVSSRVREEGIGVADWTVNNSGSLSFYILAVGIERKKVLT